MFSSFCVRDAPASRSLRTIELRTTEQRTQQLIKEKSPAVACRGFSVFQVFRDQKLR
jgi:hypothetical protein